jgi:chromosome segregation ATPase
MKNEPWRGNPMARCQHLEGKISNQKAEIRNQAARLAALEAERDQARAERDALKAGLFAAQQRILRESLERDEVRASLAAENARLREYVEHRYNCNVMTPGSDPESDPCTCGLITLLTK